MERPELSEPPRAGLLLPREAELPPVPLEHTAIEAAVVGPVADVLVAQRFRSTHSAPLDALYVFPLPADAAVRELELEIGARRVRGELRERAEARQRYEQAAAAGADAALLNQERPNLFAVEVANLQPGETVQVRLRYAARVPLDDGAFSLAIPTVATPRYQPADHDPADAARVGATPLLPTGAAGHTLAITVSLDAGRLAELESPSHEIEIVEERGRHVVRLRDGAAVPDRDFVLRYRPAGSGYAAAALSYRAPGQPGTLLVMLTPVGVPAPAAVLPRELLFVLDRSGSMAGEAIAQARNALRACLRALNPGDVFNIFPFSSQVTQLAAEPLPFTQASVDAADAYIAGIQASGGTEIRGALEAALARPADPERLRVLVFLTDGAVSNEDAVLQALASRLGEARVFAFGIGSAVNRFLLDKLAELGRGSAEYILPGEPIEPAIQRFQGRAAQPLLRDIAVDWGGARISDALPTPIPDLYAGQPLVLLARYHAPRDERATLRLTGRSARGSYSESLELDLPVATPDRGPAWALLPALWARARLEGLLTEIRHRGANSQAIETEARELALAHGLLSPYTAFVAAAEPPPDATGRRAGETVVVPIHLPAGTRREAFEPPPVAAGPSLYSVAGAAMAGPRAMAAPGRSRTPTGLAARFLNALRRDLAGAEGAPAAPPPAAPYAPTPAAAGPRRDATPSERRDAALRALARTQAVAGSWADDALATALALAAFARAGHTERAGDFRPQLGRANAWLAGAGPTPGEPQALLARLADALAQRSPELAAALRGDAEQARAALAAFQRLGGDTDGLVILPGNDPQRPDALAFALTAALALVSG